jgi:hypothetical protein
MTNSQKHQRLQTLFALSRERYLAAGGRLTGHADGNIYMTPEEKQEFLMIARSLRQQSVVNQSGQTVPSNPG